MRQLPWHRLIRIKLHPTLYSICRKKARGSRGKNIFYSYRQHFFCDFRRACPFLFGKSSCPANIFRLFCKKLLTNGVPCVIICFVTNEKLAQLAEHLPFKERVEGSNPSFLTHEYFVNTLFSCIGRTAYFLVKWALDTIWTLRRKLDTKLRAF